VRMGIIEKILEEEKSLGFVTYETICEFNEICMSRKLSKNNVVFGAQIIDRQRANKNQKNRIIVQF